MGRLKHIKEEIWEKAAKWQAKFEKNGIWIHGRKEAGLAIYFIRATLAVIITGIVWYVGNIVLFDPSTGIVPISDNLSPANAKFTATDGTVQWFWSIWPIIILIGAGVYVVYSALIREPRTY